MISASRYCLPLMKKQKALMTNNLETVARALIEGPEGTVKLTQALTNPFTGYTLPTSAVPTLNINTWKGKCDVLIGRT